MRLNQWTVVIGVILLLLAICLPVSVEDAFAGLKSVGWVTLVINPILGLVGLVSSVWQRRWLWAGLNFVLFLSYFWVCL